MTLVMTNTDTKPKSDLYRQLFCESRTELNPPLSSLEELKQMDSNSLGWWGLGYWQSEAIKQAVKAEVRQGQIDRLLAELNDARAELKKVRGY